MVAKDTATIPTSRPTEKETKKLPSAIIHVEVDASQDTIKLTLDGLSSLEVRIWTHVMLVENNIFELKLGEDVVFGDITITEKGGKIEGTAKKEEQETET